MHTRPGNRTNSTKVNDLFASILPLLKNRSDTDSVDSDIECMGSIAAPSTVDITNDDDIREFLDACDDTATPTGPIKAKGEFSIDDLPPIEELTITVPESECVELGKVSGIVGTLGKLNGSASIFLANHLM